MNTNENKNILKETDPEPAAEPAKKDHHGKKVGLKSLLDGSFLSRDNIRKQFPFMVFITFLGVAYIFSINYADKTVIEISKTKKQLQELRFDYVNTKAKLMQASRQSRLVKALATKGIKESLQPPVKIDLETKQ